MAEKAGVRVTALDLGSVRVRPDNVAGTWRPMLWWTAFSHRWTEWLPVWGFLIERHGRTVLFDTGQSRASQQPGYYPGGLIGWAFRRQAQFRVTESQQLSNRLAENDVAVEDVAAVVISHLHQDHAGGVPELPHVPIYVHEAEYATFVGRDAARHGMLTERIRTPETRFVPITFTPTDDPWVAPFTASADLFGDGSFVLLPTPGHTPGSMSLLLRVDEMRPVLFVGDVTYDTELMAAGRVPGTGQLATQRATTAKINALRIRHPELLVIAAHDPQATELIRRAAA